MNTEANIPAWYSSAALLLAAMLLWIVSAATKQRGGRPIYWRLLSLVFLALSIDEVAELHEQLTNPSAMFYTPADCFISPGLSPALRLLFCWESF